MTPRFDADTYALYALGALGALEPTEASAIDAALAAREPEVVAGVAAARRLLGSVGSAAPSAEPPSGAKDRLIARVRREGAGAASPSSRAAPTDRRPTPSLRRAWLGPVAITALLVLLTAIGLWSQLSPRGVDDDVRRLAAAAANPRTVAIDLRSAATKSVEGRVLYDPEQHALFVTGKGLSPAGVGRQYVLWILPKGGGAPRNVGPFSLAQRDRPDFTVADAPAPGDVAGYAVSSERDPLVTAPTEVRAVALSPL